MNIKDLRRAVRYAVGRPFLETAVSLPPFLGRPLFAGMGTLAYYAVARDRHLSLENLRNAYPGLSNGEVRKRARRVFRNLLTNIFDVARAPRWTAAERETGVRIEGMANLDAAVQQGRGVILFGGHQGAWELVAVGLADRGVRLTSVARTIREPRLEAWLAEHRRALGIATLRTGTLESARDARRVLARGEVLGILLDHRLRRGGVVAEFFGRPARFPAGPARLALRLNAPFLPVRIGRSGSGHTIHIGEAVAQPPAGPPSRDRVGAFVRASVLELESMIRASPEEWAWIHPRWETAPAGAPRRRPRLTLNESRLLAAALALAPLAGCDSSKTGSSLATDSSLPSSAMADFKVRETVNGRLKWILSADSAETWDTTRETLIKGLNVDFYDAEGKITSVLTADTGVLHAANNNLTGKGNVKLASVAGDTLTTEQLDWDNQKSRIRTEDRFRLARPGGWITGTGFESDQDLRNYTTEDVRIDARDGGDSDDSP